MTLLMSTTIAHSMEGAHLIKKMTIQACCQGNIKKLQEYLDNHRNPLVVNTRQYLIDGQVKIAAKRLWYGNCDCLEQLSFCVAQDAQVFIPTLTLPKLSDEEIARRLSLSIILQILHQKISKIKKEVKAKTFNAVFWKGSEKDLLIEL